MPGKLIMRREERGFGTALRDTGVVVCDRAERGKIRGAKLSLMVEHLRPGQPHNGSPKLGRRNRHYWTLGLAGPKYCGDRPCLRDLPGRLHRRSDAPGVAQCIKGKIKTLPRTARSNRGSTCVNPCVSVSSCAGDFTQSYTDM